MNTKLSFTKIATSRYPARSLLMKPVNGRSSLITDFSTTEMAGSQHGHRHSLTHRPHSQKRPNELGYRLHTWTRQITMAMTTDSGCQSVLVRIKIIRRLGFKQTILIPGKQKCRR